MALVSREVASYPMQGAVERPPAPTLSPIPNPFLSLFASLCPSSSIFAPRSLSFSLTRRPFRPSKPGQVPSVFLRSRIRRITEIPPSKPKVVPSKRTSPTLLFSLSTAVIFHTGSYSFSQVHEILADHRLSSDYQFRYTRNCRTVEE